MSRTTAAFLVAALTLTAASRALASRDEDALVQGCDWLERAIAREPARDDAFGMFMRGMRPKCQAMLEGLARKDNSVKAETVRQIVKEIDELRGVIDAEHGGPPPAVNGPSPGEQAKQKVAEEKAEVERVARDKAEAERLEKERVAAEKAAQDRAEAERIASEKAAEQEKRDAEREAAADKKATEVEKKVSEREERERVAAEKKAAEEARRAAEREERARVAAEKKAAEEARRAAEREERARVAAEKKAAEEAKRAAEREARERAEQEREEARVKARELVEAEAETERRAAEEAARRAAEETARREAEAADKRAAAKTKRPTDTKGPKSLIDGTWEQPAAKVLDRHVKRTLNLLSKDGKVQGELYEEVWFDAPNAWIDASCGGNTTFRMVTTARVSGELDGNDLELWRDPPRILTCTCSSRCTVENRRRGMNIAIGASGAELRDATGVFVRPGAVVVEAPGAGEVAKTVAPGDFAGQWETAPFKRRDQTIVQRLELTVDGEGTVTGELVERASQGLPLASWADRFCDGATKWEWVTRWVVEGKVSGRKAALRARDGANLLCTCPSKCVAPKDKLTFEVVYGATGATLQLDDRSFLRR